MAYRKGAKSHESAHGHPLSSRRPGLPFLHYKWINQFHHKVVKIPHLWSVVRRRLARRADGQIGKHRGATIKALIKRRWSTYLLQLLYQTPSPHPVRIPQTSPSNLDPPSSDRTALHLQI